MSGVVLLFGRLKDVFGAASIPLPEGAGTAAELRNLLVSENPDLADMLRARTVRIAVNHNLIADEAGTRITPSDEIALLPPLSGG